MSGIYIILFSKEPKGFYAHFSNNSVKSSPRPWRPPDSKERRAKT
jgi:hypothetical protein